MSKKQNLTRDDWIKAGFRMLAAHGPNAIRVDHLCRELEVTKGSFYWHFKDLAGFKSSMVSHWRQTTPKQLIDQATAQEFSPREMIIELFERSAKSAQGQIGPSASNAVTGTAIRHWANADRAISRELTDADNERLAFLTTQMRAAGLTGAEARSRASFLNAALIGMELLATEPALTPTNIPGLVDAMLTPSAPKA